MLAHGAYPDPSLRPFTDLDILVVGDRHEEAVRAVRGIRLRTVPARARAGLRRLDRQGAHARPPRRRRDRSAPDPRRRTRRRVDQGRGDPRRPRAVSRSTAAACRRRRGTRTSSRCASTRSSATASVARSRCATSPRCCSTRSSTSIGPSSSPAGGRSRPIVATGVRAAADSFGDRAAERARRPSSTRAGPTPAASRQAVRSSRSRLAELHGGESPSASHRRPLAGRCRRASSCASPTASTRPRTSTLRRWRTLFRRSLDAREPRPAPAATPSKLPSLFDRHAARRRRDPAVDAAARRPDAGPTAVVTDARRARWRRSRRRSPAGPRSRWWAASRGATVALARPGVGVATAVTAAGGPVAESLSAAVMPPHPQPPGTVGRGAPARDAARPAACRAHATRGPPPAAAAVPRLGRRRPTTPPSRRSRRRPPSGPGAAPRSASAASWRCSRRRSSRASASTGAASCSSRSPASSSRCRCGATSSASGPTKRGSVVGW